MITRRGIVKITDFGVVKLPRADLSERAGIIYKLFKELQIGFYKQFIATLISRLDSTSERLKR
jgi:hypothetical protein